MTTATAGRLATTLAWRFALLVVIVSFVLAGVSRWLIVMVADDDLLWSAFALVIGYMVAVGAVGFGMRNRALGGRFTLVFALVLAAVHVISAVNQGLSILAVPFDPYSTDFSAFLLVPLLYTVPAVLLRLIRWWWAPVTLAAGIAVSNVVFAITMAG